MTISVIVKETAFTSQGKSLVWIALRESSCVTARITHALSCHKYLLCQLSRVSLSKILCKQQDIMAHGSTNKSRHLELTCVNKLIVTHTGKLVMPIMLNVRQWRLSEKANCLKWLQEALKFFGIIFERLIAKLCLLTLIENILNLFGMKGKDFYWKCRANIMPCTKKLASRKMNVYVLPITNEN